MHIAPATVRNHVAAVYRKLGVRNKVQLMRALRDYARCGLVLPEPEEHSRSARIVERLTTDSEGPAEGASVAVMPFING